MPVDTNFLTGSGSTLFVQLKGNIISIDSTEFEKLSNLQHVTGDGKDTSDNEGERVQGRISLGESVDPSSGLFEVTSGRKLALRSLDLCEVVSERPLHL